MIVFRIADSENKGPYVNKNSMGYLMHVDPEVYPCPVTEGLISEAELDNSIWHCGFTSRKQLKNWFSNEEIEELIKRNYKLYSFKIDSQYVKIGTKQLIFDSSKAELIGKFKIY